MKNTVLLKPCDVLARLCISKTTLYKWVRNGLMTPSIALTEVTVVWPEHEVQAVIDAKVAGKTDEEIAALVVSLVVARKQAA